MYSSTTVWSKKSAHSFYHRARKSASDGTFVLKYVYGALAIINKPDHSNFPAVFSHRYILRDKVSVFWVCKGTNPTLRSVRTEESFYTTSEAPMYIILCSDITLPTQFLHEIIFAKYRDKWSIHTPPKFWWDCPSNMLRVAMFTAAYLWIPNGFFCLNHLRTMRCAYTARCPYWDVLSVVLPVLLEPYFILKLLAKGSSCKVQHLTLRFAMFDSLRSDLFDKNFDIVSDHCVIAKKLHSFPC